MEALSELCFLASKYTLCVFSPKGEPLPYVGTWKRLKTDFRRIYGVTYQPLLTGRAMFHLNFIIINGSCECSKCIGDSIRCAECASKLSCDRSGIRHSINHTINLRHPFCCSAFRQGWVVSAHLLRSPVSSDCAFIRMGCSVSSRYTFPLQGLGSALSAKLYYHVS